MFQLTRYIYIAMSDEPLSKLHWACADGDIHQVKDSDIQDARNKSVYTDDFAGSCYSSSCWTHA